MLLASSSVIREINVPALGTKYCLLTGCAATFSAVVANNIPINKCFIFIQTNIQKKERLNRPF